MAELTEPTESPPRPATLTTHAAAKLLKCSPNYAQRLALMGRIRYSVDLGGRIRLVKEDVERAAIQIDPADHR